ncbi:MAG: uroporphyrinogen-III synthase [bacterium]
MAGLQGKRVVITRSREDWDETAAAVRRRGGLPISCPMIDILPPEDPTPLDSALRHMESFDWIFFTSVHSVRFFFGRAEMLGLTDVPPVQVRLAVIGPATAAELARHHLHPHFTADRFTGADFVEEFRRTQTVTGKRFLLPLSSIARATIVEALREAGGEVTAVTAYRNAPVTSLPEEIVTRLQHNEIDWILFTSSSTARHFLEALILHAAIPHSFHTASIGPLTSETLREYGCPPDVEAPVHTLEGLLDAVEGCTS